MISQFFNTVRDQETQLGIHPEKGSFFLSHDQDVQTLVVLVHGFSACPGTMKRLASYFYDQGLDCYGVRLAGHGQQLVDFEYTTQEEWLLSISSVLDVAKLDYQKIVLVGCSTGALLSLRLSHFAHVCGVVCLSLFLKPCNPKFYFGIYFSFLSRIWRGSFGFTSNNTLSTSEDGPETVPDFWYLKFPIRAIFQLAICVRETKTILKRVFCPCFLIHSRYDHTAHVDSVKIAQQKLCSAETTVHWCDGGHVFILNQDSQVDQKILDFILGCSKKK